MSRTITTFGYLFALLFVLVSNYWAVKNPTKLMPLAKLLSQVMQERTTRLALGFIWWWLGWHFLYAML
ncbi:MAG: hypothetical protein RL381_173 [Actinomycetota bacterium]|jgi:hypothetical protein